MENSSLDEVAKYNEITSPEDVEDAEVLNRVYRRERIKVKKEEEEVHGMKMQRKI